MRKNLFTPLFAAGTLMIAGCTSFQEAKERADAGDPQMAYKAGVMLKEGKGVEQNTEAEKKERLRIAEKKRIAEEKRNAGKNLGKGIKLSKSIYSGLSVKEFIQSMQLPEMDFESATRMDKDGTVYCINTYGSGKKAFLAGFNGVIGKYQISQSELAESAPDGYLFGVICSFGSKVSTDALENKIKTDFPEVKEKPEQKRTDKFRSSRGIDFDVVTITKTWESEKVKATIHFVKLEFPDKSLSEAQKGEETYRLLDGFRWTDDKVRGERIDKGMPLALDDKSLIIIDKKIESKMQEIAKEAKKQHLKELEDARKKAEQKALDF